MGFKGGKIMWDSILHTMIQIALGTAIVTGSMLILTILYALFVDQPY